MKKVIIPQKMSGTGTIHDIASQHYDREIVFKEGELYAVVLASYYGNGDLYSTHKTEKAAYSKSRKEKEFCHVIIGVDGRTYETVFDGLILCSDEHYEVVEA